jgi:hypothetical protein
MRICSVLLFIVFGCAQDKAERALSEYRALRDRMCACTTADCKREVQADLDAWDRTPSGELLSKVPKNEITKDQRSQIDPIEAELKRCKH